MKSTSPTPTILMVAAVIIALIMATMTTTTMADVYMQNPRGSNNRLKGENRDRSTNNRLFDSQNNARGGFNVGNLFYYEGSVLPIEWTAQHGCGNGINHCEFVIQYMCDAGLRDGTNENRIPEESANDTKFGRHESGEYYNDCKRHSRNRGLFTSNQNMGTSATSTRQNNGGNRNGFECPEERDYYPYWRTSPWIDIAVITSQPKRCDAYRAESENVMPRWNCTYNSPMADNTKIPITREACETTTDSNGVVGTWLSDTPRNLPPPICEHTVFTRANHLGNAVGGYPLTFNWTIPSGVQFADNCALRIRYNITAGDFPGWSEDGKVQAGWDVSKNAGYFPEETYLMDKVEAKEREYYIKGNPQVDMFGDLVAKKVPLQVNLNTNQYFRTFEDRSHLFQIRKRDGQVPADAVIHNVNVKGKRGNIVQTFPATEYDFVPSRLQVTTGDFVHFQWTGSNANPNNNDGEGRNGSDRSNCVGTRQIGYNNIPTIFNEHSLLTYGAQASNYPTMIKDLTNDAVENQKNFLGWDKPTLIQLALLGAVQLGGDMDQLDDAGTYFNLPPRRVVSPGVYNYLSTRNNNFSNRSQKGQIIVSGARTASQTMGANGGILAARKGSASSTFNSNFAEIHVVPGKFVGAAVLSLTIAPKYTLDDFNVDTDGIVSDVIYVSAGLSVAALPGEAELRIDNNGSPISDLNIAFATGMVADRTQPNVAWKSLPTKTSGAVAYATITEPGAYVVRSKPNVGIIIGIIIGCVVAVAAAVFLIIFCKKRADRNATKLAGVGV